MSNTPLTIPVKNIDNEQHSVGLFDIHYVIPEKQESVFIDSANNQYAKSYDLITGWDRTLYPILYYRKIDNEIFIYLNLLDAQNGINAIATTQQLQDMITKTYSELQTLIAASGLIPGTLYKISDRGDRGIFLNAISTNKLAPKGTRIMLCPSAYYLGFDDFNNKWKGIYDLTQPYSAQPFLTTKTLDINDLVISFGHVYKITDATPDHNNIYDKFSLIEKTSFTNHEYIELCFDIKYDFTGDEILEQSDNYNNTVLTRLYRIKRDFSIFSTPYNGSRQIDAIDATDWNQFNQPYHVIFNNYGGAICNNLATNSELVITSNIGVDIIGNRSSLIASNKTINKNPVSGDDSFHEITGNKADIIINNECNYINNNLGYGAVISNNMCQFIWANNYSEISYNKCNFIAGNRLSGNSRILRNYINGDISGNTDIDSIMDNCNNGSIQQNTSSVGASILSNCNNGSIANSERSSNVSDPIVNK